MRSINFFANTNVHYPHSDTSGLTERKEAAIKRAKKVGHQIDMELAFPAVE